MTSVKSCTFLCSGLLRSLGTARSSSECQVASSLVSSSVGLAYRRSMSTGVVRGLNIQKNGQDPDEMKDEEVPDWLRDLGRHGAGRTLPELERKAELTIQEARQLAKLKNRQNIKRANSLSSN